MRNLFFLLLAGGLLFSCQPNEGGVDAMGYSRTDSGVRYKIITDGEGPEVNGMDYVYFQARLVTEGDSTIFDTREGGADNIPVIQAAPDSIMNLGPVEDAIRFLGLNDVALIRVNIENEPPQNKPAGMANDTVIVYEIEVTEVVNEEEFGRRRAAKEAEAEAARELVRAREPELREFSEKVRKDYARGRLQDVQETASGLKYVIHEEGTGEQAQAGRGVMVQYIGRLVENGEVFDQSFERGEGIPFILGTGRVIPGWDEGIALLKEGAKATFFIPAELAYGAQGSRRPGQEEGGVPPNAELAFYVELEDVQ